jgi:hypothetical protein
MAKKPKISFYTSFGDWLAEYDGKIIADTPITKNQKVPPNWFKQLAKQYVRETYPTKKKLKKVI